MLVHIRHESKSSQSFLCKGTFVIVFQEFIDMEILLNKKAAIGHAIDSIGRRRDRNQRR